MKNNKALVRINYYKGNCLTSVLWVDYRTNEVEVINYTDELCYRAMGINENPTIQDFNDFLEDRCFPRERDHCKEILKSLGLDYYDPYEIVKKTKGMTGEDDCWLELLEGQNYDNL